MPKLPPQRHDALAGLFGEDPTPTLDGAALLPLAAVDPNPAQARQVFDEPALAELAASIATHGVLQPIVVRPVGDRWQVVAGERRTRAAQLAGLTHIPAIIRDLTDEQAAYVTAVENLQREDLDLEDEARWLQYLYEHTPDATYRKIGDMIGKSHVYVVRRLQLLAHPDLLQQVRTGALTQRAALKQLETPLDPADVESLVHGVPNPPTIVERATLDSAAEPVSSPAVPTFAPHPPVYQPPYLGADPAAAPLQRTPWRDRPLMSFMEWAARVDPSTLRAADERARARRVVAEARGWLARLEEQLTEEDAE